MGIAGYRSLAYQQSTILGVLLSVTPAWLATTTWSWSWGRRSSNLNGERSGY
jgi:hypothetical protein